MQNFSIAYQNGIKNAGVCVYMVVDGKPVKDNDKK